MRTVSLVILAAGSATRMEAPKLVLDLGGRPLVRWVADTACCLLAARTIQEVVVVTGAYRETVEAALEGLPVRTIYNPEWADGQGSSVAVGTAGIDPKAAAAVYMLADQPLVPPAAVAEVIRVWRVTGSSIVVPSFSGRRVNPVLFDLGRWRQCLEKIRGDAGGRQIITGHPGEVATADLTAVISEKEAFRDVDTPADWEILRQRVKPRLEEAAKVKKMSACGAESK